MRHDAEEEERGVEAATLAAERREHGVVGDGVADGREGREECWGFREGHQAEQAVEARGGLGAATAEEHGEERRGAPRRRARGRGGRDGGGDGHQGTEDAGARVLPRHGGWKAWMGRRWRRDAAWRCRAVSCETQGPRP